MILFLRSLAFNIGFYGFTVVTVVTAIPILFLPRKILRRVMRSYTFWVELMLRVLCNVRVHVEGMEHIPPGACLIVSKHGSAFDTVFWLSRLPDPCYVMKVELMRLPLWGWLARHLEMISVDRDGGGAALKQMVRDTQKAAADGRQIIIYPEGTRVAPDVQAPYQPGVAAMAAVTKLPVIPVATNSAWFWGRRAFTIHPGILRVKVLPALPPNLPRAQFMATLEEVIEGETALLPH